MNCGVAMIPMHYETCPLDRSELVFLSGRFAWQGKFDVASYYCPRCDAGFVCWANPAFEKPVVFTWRRKGSDLSLDTADVPKVSDYLTHGWEVAQSGMLHGIRLFLQGRFTERQGCPNDGGKIPLIAESPCHEGSPVRFYWCGYCEELFAYLKDEFYGWQYISSFSHDKTDGYKPWKTFIKTPFAEVIRECAASLPAPSAFRR